MMHLVAGCVMEASYGILSKEHELPWGLLTTNINI